MLSPDGHCKTFDASADGYARAEAFGAVFVTQQQMATSLATPIVDIASTGTNQDGRTASLTAPNGPSQSKLIKNMMDRAGVEAKAITISECHGTGTGLGDPIEVGALRAVLCGEERGIHLYFTFFT